MWLVVFIDYSSRKKRVIVNNRDELIDFYNKTKDNFIFIGFNSRNYDTTILKSIILGLNPYEVSQKIIVDGLKPFQISKSFNSIPLLSYDTMVDRGSSLKLLEGMMGDMIKESDVSFDLDRELTEDEIKETIYYCTHDVEETIEVFERTIDDFNAHLGLIKTFNLPLSYFNKTKAQISCEILGGERIHGLSEDELQYEFLDIIELGKYEYIREWFDTHREYHFFNDKGIKKPTKLTTEVYGLETVFGFGGVHGAIKKYNSDTSDNSIIVHSDVASYYPNMMIHHNKLSRCVSEPQRYSDILEKRLTLKRQGKKKEQAPFKIVLNGTFGISKDKYSKLYDPKRANEICINCQLLLVDLLENLEREFGDRIEPIQYNTDGIIMKLKDKSDLDKYKEVCKEWETRTQFELEHDMIDCIYQKDVNNYVFKFSSGKLECKGAYVQENTDLKNDMSILNDAVRNYLMYDVPVEDTINNCDELIKFQHINKIGSTYYKVMWGDKELKEKTIRTFACTKDVPTLYKVKRVINKDGQEVDSVQKVANNSEHVFINNENIKGESCPNYLDKEWYINEAKKRLKGFGCKLN